MRIEFDGWVLFAAAAVVVVVVWLAAPGPPPVGDTSREPERWQLPQPAKGPSPQSVEMLAKSALWGKLPESDGAAALGDPAWRFIGIAKRGEDRFVLIKVEGQPERRLGINDELPGGSRILEIGEDSLCILINGTRRKLAIHDTGRKLI